MANGRLAIEARGLRTLFELGAAGIRTDGQLLERFAAREGEAAELAFAALVDRHGPMVLRVARSILRDDHAAHDAFQATFLILARKSRTLWVRDSVGPWLHAVALRVAMNGRSSAARRRRHERGAAGPESTRPRDPDDLGRAIHEEIDRLPAGHRSAIVLCHLEGLTQHEAARRLGWPVGTLQSRLARGRARLRDRLARRGLAPTLGILAPGSAPETLVAATARAAAALHGGGAIAGMIAPPVLAMIHATTKGMLMAKLKLGAVALIATFGLVASAIVPGAVRSQGATGGPPPPPQAQGPKAGASVLESVPVPETARGADLPSSKVEKPEETATVLEPAPPPATTASEETIPPPRGESLLYFHAPWSGPCRQMGPEIEKLTRRGYPIRSFNIDDSDLARLARRFGIITVPTLVRIDPSERELGRVSGYLTAARVAEFYNNGGAVPSAPAPVEGKAWEPRLTLPTQPMPWKTVVRIKIKHSLNEWGFCSGTIIDSTDSDATILTCAHNLGIKGRPTPDPKDYRVPIAVDLFDGQLSVSHPAVVRTAVNDLSGDLIACDSNSDLALIRIRPDRRLEASRVAPPDWKPVRAMRMIAVGCSQGNDATAWDTVILDPHVQMYMDTMQTVHAIKCQHQPTEGRSGGGLFTSDGYLSGVCTFAVPQDHTGLYSGPDSLHAFLDRNGLRSAFERETTHGIRPDPEGPTANLLVLPGPTPDATAPPRPLPSADQGRRLDELERKLDRLLDALQDIKKGGPPPRSSRQP